MLELNTRISGRLSVRSRDLGGDTLNGTIVGQVGRNEMTLSLYIPRGQMLDKPRHTAV